MLVDRRAMRLVIPYVAAIGVFSANGHKEWRFILPAVPVLNICAAAGVSRLCQARGVLRRVVRPVAAAICLISLASAILMMHISSLNYPGGHALALLHRIEHPAAAVRVHIDTYAAMTGITRFGELRQDWIYDKTEMLLHPSEFSNYTHLLTSTPKLHKDTADRDGFVVIAEQYGYTGILTTPLSLIPKTILFDHRLPFEITQKPLVWIMRKK
ncbi:hypothetical protein EV177_009689 [Coemansia sp. RSA 1804]|nr:hypothetical protein EV177_009689 [Coemansia sp. RSA 1804]